MYNEEIKERYINFKQSTTSVHPGYLDRLFDKTKNFEYRLNKDVCCFTVYEIVDLYKTLNVSSVESLVVINSHLSLYTDWCLKQNMVSDCQNHFSEVDSDLLLKCINMTALKKSIITRETLYSWIDELPNPSDAFIMLALFEGIKGKDFCEIVHLKWSDFNGNKVSLCTGRELIVSDRLVELAQKSNNTLEHVGVNGSGLITKPLLNEDLIVKNYSNCDKSANDFYLGRRIYRRLDRNFKFLGVDQWIRPQSLVESGKIDYINTRSKELGISGKEFIYSEYAKELEYRYSYDITRLRLSYYRKYGEYLV